MSEDVQVFIAEARKRLDAFGAELDRLQDVAADIRTRLESIESTHGGVPHDTSNSHEDRAT